MKNILILLLLVYAPISQAGIFSKSKNNSGSWPWPVNITARDGLVCSDVKCTLTEDLNNLNKANNFCRDVYNYYEKSLNRQNRTPYLVGILGSLAGVFSPISSGDMAKGLAGFSGAANALQLSTTKAVQNTVSVNTLKFIDRLVYAGNTEFIDSENKTVVAINMASRCAYAASSVEAAILEGTQQAITKLDKEEKKLVPSETH